MATDRDLEDFLTAADRHGISAFAKQAGVMDLSTPGGRVGARIGVSIAKYENEVKGERQIARNLQAAQAGLPHVTHRPLGYEKDCRTIRPDETEQLKLMAKLVIDGNSCRRTAYQLLNERGYRTARGKKWIGLTVRRTIQNPRYVAIRRYRGVDYVGKWPAIWDDETWQQLQLVVRLRRDANTASPARKFLLTGLLYCGECGNMLTGVTEKHNRTKQERRAYRCFRRGRTERTGGCGKVYRDAGNLETYLRDLVLYRLDTPGLAKLLSGDEKSQQGLQTYLSERSKISARLDRQLDDYDSGSLTRVEYAKLKQRAEAELVRIDKEIARLTASTRAIDIPLDQTLAQAWDSHRDEWRRRLLGLLIERVTVNRGNGNKTVRRPDGTYYQLNPELVEIEWLA